MKTHRFYFFSLSVIFLLILSALKLQATEVKLDTLPKVFLIGEFDAEYEDLVANCNVPLFNVCDGSMDKAYRAWLGVLQEIEEYAASDSFDINGLKIWINVFWKGNGEIAHIGYYPKPNSKNLDFDKLTDFFGFFINEYKLGKEYDGCFSHYGSATFPTHADYYLKKE